MKKSIVLALLLSGFDAILADNLNRKNLKVIRVIVTSAVWYSKAQWYNHMDVTKEVHRFCARLPGCQITPTVSWLGLPTSSPQIIPLILGVDYDCEMNLIIYKYKLKSVRIDIQENQSKRLTC
jgi:hypothetical protein